MLHKKAKLSKLDLKNESILAKQLVFIIQKSDNNILLLTKVRLFKYQNFGGALVEKGHLNVTPKWNIWNKLKTVFKGDRQTDNEL